MSAIVFTTLIVTAIGLICGAALAVIAKKFGIEEDPRIGTVADMLPNVNCGVCGYAGCAAYAKSIVTGEAQIGLCVPGGHELVEKLEAVLGRRGTVAESRKAVILCNGSNDVVKRRSDYNGVRDCYAANIVAGGDKSCSYGCLGYGTCIRACSLGAIKIESGLAKIDYGICRGCGLCAKVCPRNLIKVVPVQHKLHVLCSSQDKGAVVRKNCARGCIGCGICVKLAATPNADSGAITLKGSLAVVDYSKEPIVNDTILEKCPPKCICKI